MSVLHVVYEWDYKFFSHLQTKVINYFIKINKSDVISVFGF